MQTAIANQSPALFCAVPAPGENREGVCSAPGCSRRARVQINGKGACGRGHLELVLSDGLRYEQGRAARARLRVSPVLPVGQHLLRTGAVSEAALADALGAQERAGAGRIGAWLRQQSGLAEHALAAALAAQNGCAVLSLADWQPDPALAPQAVLEQCGGIPLRRLGDAGSIAVGFEDAGCPELLRALERVHNCRIIQGVLPATVYWEAARTWLALRQPPAAALGVLPAGACPDALASFLLDANASSASLAVLGDQVWLRYAATGDGCERNLLCRVDGEAAEPVEDAPVLLGQTA